jgi:hypothetical protein
VAFSTRDFPGTTDFLVGINTCQGSWKFVFAKGVPPTFSLDGAPVYDRDGRCESNAAPRDAISSRPQSATAIDRLGFRISKNVWLFFRHHALSRFRTTFSQGPQSLHFAFTCHQPAARRPRLPEAPKPFSKNDIRPAFEIWLTTCRESVHYRLATPLVVVPDGTPTIGCSPRRFPNLP